MTLTHYSPELSIVVAARNDSHGVDFLHRVQLFVTGLLEQAHHFGANWELVIVEWNPPEGQPRLRDALTWPSSRKCSVRIIEVPPSLHKRYRYAEKLLPYQMIAKNVGIRRAQGRFILATNADILFSDEVAAFLSSGNLRTDLVYRIDRYDIPSDIPGNLSVEDRLDYCKGHILRVNTRNGTPNVVEARSQRTLNPHFIIPPTAYFFLKSRQAHLQRSRGKRTSVPRESPKPATRVLWFVKSLFRAPYPHLHMNACGDFTLFARESWFALHGYPEFDMYPLHLDSLLLHMAYNYGLHETVLQDPMRIYHLEHPHSWNPDTEEEIRERLNRLGVPMLELEQCEPWFIRMYYQKRPLIFNDEAWGLASQSLPETRVV